MKLTSLKKYLRAMRKSRGFILPLTLLVCLIILIVANSISTILAKELYFSKVSRQSQVAYYSADNAMMCAIMVDDTYLDPDTGLGIFPYNGLSSNPTADMQTVLDKINTNRQAQGFAALALNDIKCATSDVFNASVSTSAFLAVPFTRVNSASVVENGQKSSFNMKMDLGDGTFRCASVLIYKTSNYRQIIARGFTSCTSLVGTPIIERAIVNTTEVR